MFYSAIVLILYRTIAVGAIDVKAEPFVLQEDGLLGTTTTCHEAGNTCKNFEESSRIPFDRSWLRGHMNEDVFARLDVDVFPEYLSVPDFVRVYSYQHDANDTTTTDSLADLAQAARRIVDSDLPEHGVVLFRNLNERISTAKDFAEFWNGVHEGSDAWKPVKFFARYAPRRQLEGVDLVNHNFPSTECLRCHNEDVSRPNPPSRIAFYCLEPAMEGGETLLVKNEQLTQDVRPEIQELVREAGVLYTGEYYDRYGIHSTRGLHWQWVTGTDDKEEAVRFFIEEHGFDRDNFSFDENGTLMLRVLSPGFRRDSITGKEMWYNKMSEWGCKQPDGTDFPWDDVVQAQFDEWKHVSAFKLEKGDWLVLDNHKLQHGRLPFVNDPEGAPRTIMVVYTE